MHHNTRRAFVVNSLAIAGMATLAPPFFEVRLEAGQDQTEAFLRAIRAGDLATVSTMLASEATLIGARDESGRSPFAVALLSRRPEIANVIRQAGHQPDVHESALALDWDRFNELADADPAQVNAHHPIGGSTMTAAALGGAGTDMWRIYAQSAVPNPPRAQGTTMSPLRAALEFDDLPTAELSAAMILANGADPNEPEPGGRSPLHVAAARGSIEMIEMLIRKSAATGARDADGRTALERAEQHGHRAAADMLRNHTRIARDHSTSRRLYDVNGNPCREPDWSGLEFARRRQVVGSSHRNLEAVRAELEQDSRLAHSVSTTTEGAVEAGAHMGNQAIVELLLEHGAPYSLPTAVMRGDTARARALLTEDRRRINERGAHDFGLLWYTVIGGGHLELAELLLDAGADIEHQHHLGTTALHWAAMRGQIDLARLFIERGANVNRVGRKFGGRSRTPLASAGSDDAMATLLRQHGATS